MKNIIDKVIKGGYRCQTLAELPHYQFHRLVVLESAFWETLGKMYKWDFNRGEGDWIDVALHFHSLNLQEGWEKAVEYLSSLTLKKKTQGRDK